MRIIDNMRIEVSIPTKSRYDNLAMCLWSLAEQTYKDFCITIVDDTDEKERKDIREIPYILPIINRLERDGHIGERIWRLFYGPKKGCHHCQQVVLENTRCPYIWRIDDDENADKRALEYLVEAWKENSKEGAEVGAIAPIVYLPDFPSELKYLPIGFRSFKKFQGKIDEYGNLFGDQQWRLHQDEEQQFAEHLHSTFLYSVEAAKKIGGYDLLYNQVGHREDTDISYRLFKAGYKTLIEPKALVWHLKNPTGGIRAYNNPNMYAQCQERYMKKFGFIRTLNEDRVIKIIGGLGDHLCITPMLRKLHEKGKVVVSAIYPYLFQGNPNVDELIFNTEEELYAQVDQRDVYLYGITNDFKGKLSEAWCKTYDVEYDGDKLDYVIYPQEKEWAEEASVGRKFIIISTTGGIPNIQYFDSAHGFINSSKMAAANSATNVKNWFIDRWEELVDRIQKELNIFVYQVGGAKDEKINGCDEYFLGIDYRLSIALLEKSLGFISVDTFLGHAGAAVKKTGVVLFGPTMPETFGHDLNINICHSETCDREKSCHRGVETKFQWLSHTMNCDTMQCMKSISVEEVFEAIKEVLKTA